MERTNKASYSDGEDRISRLPDNLIHCIMSFNDTKYAVQTCVLSKRWIYVWKSLPFLNFNRSSFAEKKKHSFITFVDMVFICREDVDIQRLSVRWEKSADDNAVDSVTINVNKWCLHAVKYNVQEICVGIGQLHNSAYGIPPGLLNCKSLRKLVLKVFDTDEYIDIILPRSVNLPQLKELTIYGFSICNLAFSKRLLSGCPVLETLCVIVCDFQTDEQKNMIVDSVSLEKFDYRNNLFPQNDITNIINLCAPNLKTFLFRSFLTQDYSLENSSPLSEVTFYMFLRGNKEDENADAYDKLPSEEKEAYAKRMMKYLGAVHMVNDMRSSPGFLEVLSRAPGLSDCQPPRLCNLECLTLEMWCTRGCLRAIAYLLSISPNIGTIFLLPKKSTNLADVGDDWESGLTSPEMMSHLKYVQIEEAEGCDAEFKILRFLLKNAKDLVEVSVFFRSSVGLPDRAGQIKHFKKQLRSVPTPSSNVELVFH